MMYWTSGRKTHKWASTQLCVNWQTFTFRHLRPLYQLNRCFQLLDWWQTASALAFQQSACIMSEKISIVSRISAVFFTYRDNSAKPNISRFFFPAIRNLKKNRLGGLAAKVYNFLKITFDLYSCRSLYTKQGLIFRWSTYMWSDLYACMYDKWQPCLWQRIFMSSRFRFEFTSDDETFCHSVFFCFVDITLLWIKLFVAVLVVLCNPYCVNILLCCHYCDLWCFSCSVMMSVFYWTIFSVRQHIC